MTSAVQGEGDSSEGELRRVLFNFSLPARFRIGDGQLDSPSRLGDQYLPGDRRGVGLACPKVAQVG